MAKTYNDNFFSPLAYSSQFIQAHDNKDMTVIAKY